MMKKWNQYGGRIILIGTLAIIAIEFAIALITGTVNQELAMIIITTVLVATTMYYSLLNDRLLENNQRLLRNNDRLLENTNLPKIVLYIRPWTKIKSQHIFVIENIGTGIAFDIQLEVLGDQPFMLTPDLSLITAPCAKINSMAPKQDYKTLIESEDWNSEKRQTLYNIKVSYKDWKSKELSETFSISIEASDGYMRDNLVEEYLKDIALYAGCIANELTEPPSTNGSTPNIDQMKQEEDVDLLSKKY